MALRWAFHIRPGHYDFSFDVPFYTSVAGVAETPHDVTVRSFNVPPLGGTHLGLRSLDESFVKFVVGRTKRHWSVFGHTKKKQKATMCSTMFYFFWVSFECNSKMGEETSPESGALESWFILL